jgi:putative N6-adenine-specific DNA methylase
LRIIASDHSQDAVNITKINAEVAGVKHLIDVELCDYAQTTVPESANGVVFFNPEYGDRLGTEKALEEIYAGMGDFMKQRCKGYKGYIFTGNLNLAKKVGLKASRRIEFFNGKIDCRLLEYELYAGSREK